MNKNVKEIAGNDVIVLLEKEKTYGDSWKKRGGIGAFMMLARKWDRIENQCAYNGFDIFQCNPSEKDGLLDDISDLRRYLLLVESEILTNNLGKIETIPFQHDAKYPDDYQEQLAAKMEKMREDAMFGIPEHLRDAFKGEPETTSSLKRHLIEKEFGPFINTSPEEYVSPMLNNFWNGEEPQSQGYVNQDGNDQHLSSNPTKY